MRFAEDIRALDRFDLDAFGTEQSQNMRAERTRCMQREVGDAHAM
jgi:hypothetical protein